MVDNEESESQEKRDATCGIVMPISTIGECSADHWVEVRKIIESVIESTGFKPKLVSDADDSGIIQTRIIQNLYYNDIVVCDVSCKNPNVMFELGLRLAFDKPTIIIKDNLTDYSFDTSPIDHLEYPRDLRYSGILNFRNELNKKIEGTYKKSQEDSEYTTFLGHFGSFTVTSLQETEITKEDLILSRLDELLDQIHIRFNRALNDKTPQSSRINILQFVASTYVGESDHINSTDDIIGNDEIKRDLYDYMIKNNYVASYGRPFADFNNEIDDALLPF